MKLLHNIILMLIVLFVSLYWTAKGFAVEPWKHLAVGIEYGLFHIKSSSEVTERRVHVVRVNPQLALLRLLLASELDKRARTTAEWCREFNLVAAINAGMFQQDLLTNVGYLRNGHYIQNKRWNKYKSALGFNPRKTGIPPAIMVDLDTPGAKEQLSDYHAVIQNLRLMKSHGVNVWTRSDKKWSEAALGMDGKGRLLFFFCPWPFTMWDFIEGIKSLGLGVERLMHLEGGALASMHINVKWIERELDDGHEALSYTAGLNRGKWPIPNVIGIQVK